MLVHKIVLWRKNGSLFYCQINWYSLRSSFSVKLTKYWSISRKKTIRKHPISEIFGIRSQLSFRFESESQVWIRVPESQIRIWTLYWRVCHWLQCKEDLRVPSNTQFSNLTFWNYLTFESLMAIFAPFQPCILSFMEWKGQVLQRERWKIQHIFTIKCPFWENEVVVMTWKMFRFLTSLFLSLPRGKKDTNHF